MKNRSQGFFLSPSQGSEYISLDTDHIWQICVSPTTKCPVKKISQTSWTIFFQYPTSHGANKWLLMFKDLFLSNTSWLFLALTTCTYHFLEASCYVFEDVSWIMPLNWPNNCILNSAAIFKTSNHLHNTAFHHTHLDLSWNTLTKADDSPVLIRVERRFQVTVRR